MTRRIFIVLLCFAAVLTPFFVIQNRSPEIGDMAWEVPYQKSVKDESIRATTAEELAREAVGVGWVKLYYATDRRWTGMTVQPKWFGYDWNAEQGHLSYGTCDVSIPITAHEKGKVEKPSIFKMEILEDPSKHVVVYTPERLARAEFFDGLANEVRQRNEKEIVVFIHGFNTTFDDAASRLGVLTFDMEFGGVPVLYSWCSMGGPLGALAYVHDRDIITSTDTPLADFLESVAGTAREAGARRLSVIAHSMGNRPLVAALKLLAARSNGKLLFDEVVMAAPDIRAAGFANDEWPLMQGNNPPAKRVTLYASSDDNALWISNGVQGFRRIGEGGEGLMVLPGLDTIDASGCDFTRIGLHHTYFGGPRVLSDLRKLIRDGLTPPERKLRKRERQGLAYWLLPEPMGSK